jgi:hypothetical protein
MRKDVRDEYTEQIELLAFDHKPIRPPRACTIGEVVMSEHWEIAMQAEAKNIHDDCDEYAFRALMHAFPRPLTQRHASVAASFIRWLGCNCGRGFLHDAEKLKEKFHSNTNAYVAAWAIENMREVAINRGVRIIEAAIAPDDHWKNGYLEKLPDLSADDYEVVDNVVIWLGSKDGQDFLNRAEREITRRLDAERNERMRAFKRATRPGYIDRNAWR